MFKPLVALALLTIASGHEFDRIAGTWNILNYLPTNSSTNPDRSYYNLNITNEKLTFVPADGSFRCEHNGEEKMFPALNITAETHKAGESAPKFQHRYNLPLSIARSVEDARDLSKPEYRCPSHSMKGNIGLPSFVLRFIDENYAVLYYPDGFVSLMSKLQPDANSVKSVIESDPVLSVANSLLERKNI